MYNTLKKSSLLHSPQKSFEEELKETSRPCIKIKEFKYKPQKSNEKEKKNEKQHIPIRALLKKMEETPEFSEFNQKDKIKMIMSQLQFYSSKKSSVDVSYKKFITPRDTSYQPKPFMFDRYNYQNYENYQYKNPYKPAKYPIAFHMMKQPNRTVKSGTQKNLEIVFCQKKFHEFVQKTNREINQYYQINRAKSLSNLPTKSHNTLKTNFSRSRSQVKPDNKKVLPQRKKSNLANYLQEFTTLEKLSQYMEREHKLNEKFLFSPSHDKSNTVLIEILVHRFDFLKKMKKKCLEMIFKVLLSLEELPKYYKINIQDYLKFIQLFVYRDADSFAVSMFIFSFLFKEHQEISMIAVKKSMDLLGGTAHAHEEIEQAMEEMIRENPHEGQKIFQAMKGNDRFQRLFIDLILS